MGDSEKMAGGGQARRVIAESGVGVESPAQLVAREL